MLVGLSRWGADLPIAISWNDIVDPQLLADLLDSQMQRVGLELLARHVRLDHCRQTREVGRLVVGGIAPSVSLLATPVASWNRLSYTCE